VGWGIAVKRRQAGGIAREKRKKRDGSLRMWAGRRKGKEREEDGGRTEGCCSS
jgi:hypothetical protein